MTTRYSTPISLGRGWVPNAAPGSMAWRAGMVMGIMIIPMISSLSEDALSAVPNALREAAYALGTPKWKVILSITLKSVRAGVLTGILLAVARIAGIQAAKRTAELVPLCHPLPITRVAVDFELDREKLFKFIGSVWA